MKSSQNCEVQTLGPDLKMLIPYVLTGKLLYIFYTDTQINRVVIMKYHALIDEEIQVYVSG